jgi:serine/threonine protein kinase/tetratricopeptide (TPR) repeat protein
MAQALQNSIGDDRWRRIEEVFHAAADLTPVGRAAFLARSCAGDSELRRQVETLLAQDVLETAQATLLMSGPDETVFGPYHLLQLIGQGGMGEVWLAEQKEPVRRRVAVKLIKAGMDTREVIARFESERQALALMDHPAIAKVFDAGSTPKGRPYFVMEFVSGMPITDYCNRRQLTSRQRLELFISVCEGVQYAHQKAIIHRDLKPSNILVGEVDGRPRPRIIDFGVAKATSQRLTAKTMLTQVGAMVGTPGYMSPEQADSCGQDTDTRTDVYSLGVLLYELLVGELPVDLTKVPLDQIPRHLRERDVLRPSTKLSTRRQRSNANAHCRGPDARSLARELRGDLDAITLKALEYDRSRRYATPSELAADLERHLHHQPVIARPASAGYRARKYVRRHRAGVALAIAITVLLVSFTAFQTFQLRRITRERDRADRITKFMTEMFKVSDPGSARGDAITAREILDKASKEVASGLIKDAELQAQMMQIMGNVYESLGLYPQAEALLSRAVEIQRRVLGSQNPNTLRSTWSLGWTVQDQGRFGEAEKLLRETLNTQRRVLGPDHPDTLRSMNALAATLAQAGRLAEAEKVQREALEIRRLFGSDQAATATAINNLANVLVLEGQFAEAEKLQREAFDTRRRILGPDHPDTLASMSNLSVVLLAEGQATDAEKLAQAAVDIQRRVLGREPVGSMDNLAEVFKYEGRYAEAEKLHREVLEVRCRVLGLHHPATLLSMSNLSGVLEHEGKYSEAEKLQRECYESRQRVLGLEHPDSLSSLDSLAGILKHEGRYAEAEELQRKLLDLRRRTLGPDHPQTALSLYQLGVLALDSSKREQAVSLLKEAVDHGLSAAKDLAIEKDPDLKALHGDPRFEALVAHAKELATEAQKPR